MRSSIAPKGDLLALRDGSMSFSEFVARNRENIEARARYFLARWPGQTLLVETDLTQEGLMAVWMAVRSWDPERRTRAGDLVPITRYVEYQVGKALESPLRKALGRPSKTRSKPARQVAVEDVGALLEPLAPPQGERLEALERATENVGRLPAECFEREVVERVLEGASLAEVASAIYADPLRRLRHRLDSEEHAIRYTRAAARRAAAVMMV